MDPLNEFRIQEAEKLSGWISQQLALKEAKVHATDTMATVRQRESVTVEIVEMADTPTSQPPVAESKTGLVLGDAVDLSLFYNKDEIDAKLDEFYDKGEIDGFFEDYFTKEEVDDKLSDYYTKSEIDSLLSKNLTDIGIDYADKDWVKTEILYFLRGLGIDAQCENGQVSVNLTGIP